MKLHQTTTEYNCGVDLHSRSMYICVMDKEGNKMVHRNIKRNDFKFFLHVVEDYRDNLTVACESTFNWYWLADACADAKLKFVLGHALYMRAIHGTKSKNDKVDSEKIAHLLRSNLLPEAYTCRSEIRPTRDLMRRRINLVRQRTGLLAHMTSAVYVDGLEPLTTQEKQRGKRKEVVPDRFDHPLRKLSVEADIYLAGEYDKVIDKLEREIINVTKNENPLEYSIVRTIPGVGRTCGLIILYEIDSIDRFQSVKHFCSYSRLINADSESAGKPCGHQGSKMGNAYLKWVFTEVAVLGKARDKMMRKYFEIMETKHGKQKAHRIIAHKLGKSVYFILKRQEVFDIEKFIGKYWKRVQEATRAPDTSRVMAVSPGAELGRTA